MCVLDTLDSGDDRLYFVGMKKKKTPSIVYSWHICICATKGIWYFPFINYFSLLSFKIRIAPIHCDHFYYSHSVLPDFISKQMVSNIYLSRYEKCRERAFAVQNGQKSIATTLHTLGELFFSGNIMAIDFMSFLWTKLVSEPINFLKRLESSTNESKIKINNPRKKREPI